MTRHADTAPELLAPAGNWECARAAVANGADAIFFGMPRFNARMRAHNFTEADFLSSDGVNWLVFLMVLGALRQPTCVPAPARPASRSAATFAWQSR